MTDLRDRPDRHRSLSGEQISDRQDWYILFTLYLTPYLIRISSYNAQSSSILDPCMHTDPAKKLGQQGSVVFDIMANPVCRINAEPCLRSPEPLSTAVRKTTTPYYVSDS